MIQAYPFPASVAPGEELGLHISADSPGFLAEFFVQRAELVKLLTLEFRSLGRAEPGTNGSDWNWPRYGFTIPSSWYSGVYLVRLHEISSTGQPLPSNQLRDPEMLFVVRNRKPGATILFKIPLTTYHAYNAVGGGSLYETPSLSAQPPGRIVSIRRPGGGVGGFIPCCVDVYDPATVRNSYYHWDAPFLAWLHGHNYAFDSCTSLDLHFDPSLLGDYSLLVVGAHDEYWSEGERRAVERFVSRGGNVAFFGGNTCWWRVHYDPQMTHIVCDKGDIGGCARDQWWSPSGAKEPEDSLTGVSYRNGGGWWEGPRERLGYRVQNSRHWVYEGTGLEDGDSLGSETGPPLIGYECDGAPLSGMDSHGKAFLHPAAGERGTPPGLEILGAAKLSEQWQDLPPREERGLDSGPHAATMVFYQAQGMVFDAATTDWVKVLASGQCPAVERVSHNILQTFSRAK
jgi:N,N-dimethylformamidase beta subunit-like protein